MPKETRHRRGKMLLDMEIVIRPARVSDVTLIHGLIKSSIEESPILNAEAKKDGFRKYGLSQLHDLLSKDNNIILVAVGPTDTVHAVILLGLDGGVVHLNHMVVADSLRRQGLGSLFIREVLKIAKQLSAHRVTGFTRSNDIATQVLASREGFSIIGHCANFWFAQDYVLWSRAI